MANCQLSINNYQVPEGYKQTEVGVIPEDWDVRPIGETVTLINGRAFKPSDWSNYGLPIIRIQNLNDPMGAYNYYEGAVEERYYVNHGDILFAWSGTKESSFGARMWHGQKAILNQHIFRVVPDEEKITAQYILLALKKFQEEIEKKSHGFKSSFVHIRKSDLENTYLTIPPLPEQGAIAATLSDVDALIASLDKLIAKQRHLKTATMQQLLTGKKRLPGFGEGKGHKQTEVGLIPEDWDVATLGDFADKVGSGITPTGGSRVYKDSGRPFIRSQNVGWGFLQLEDLAHIDEETHQSFTSSEIREGDVLLNITGASIGRSCLADDRIAAGNVNQHVCIIRTDQNRLISRFLGLVILSKDGQRQIESFQAGGNREGLNFGQIRSFQIRMPQTVEEQNAIATVLSDMDAAISALETRRAKTQVIKQGMMQELLTGRTRLV